MLKIVWTDFVGVTGKYITITKHITSFDKPS